MIKKSVFFTAFVAIALFCTFQLNSKGKNYENPVIGKDWPDPTAWQADDGTFYCIATMGPGYRTIMKSQNLAEWEDTGIAPFSRETLDEMHKYGRLLWAPDMAKVGNKWMLYYTLYNADVDSSIGVLSSDSPTGPWTFEGVVTRSIETGIKDTIDPELVIDPENGNVWLFFGSVGKIHRVRLTDDGTKVAPGAKYEHVAGIDINFDHSRQKVFEGAYLHYHKGYWYLFASAGHYFNHTYHMVVGRSKTLDGEFITADGKKMTDGCGTIILKSEDGDTFYGPGHNGEIFTDKKGNQFILYHCHSTEAKSPNIRYTLLQQIFWDKKTGWPYFKNGKPCIKAKKPKF